MMIETLPRQPATHLRLMLLGTGAALAERIGEMSPDWLAEYAEEIAMLGGQPMAPKEWSAAVARWAKVAPHLPLLRLGQALADPLAIDLLLSVGLAAEDARLGALLGEENRPTFGTLVALLRDRGGTDDPGAVRQAANRLIRAGLISVGNPDAPRLDWQLAVSTAAWDALSGDSALPRGCRLLASAELIPIDGLVASPALIARARTLAAAMASDAMLVPLLRGPARNGRTILAGALAREIGKPLLVVDAGLIDNGEAWQQIGLTAFLSDAVVAVAPTIGPGEVRVIPEFPVAPVRLIVTAGISGGIRLDDRPQMTLATAAPDLAERAAHWRAALPGISPDAALGLATGFRLTSGAIRRAAMAAQLIAGQAGRLEIGDADVRAALRDLQDGRLETVAARVETGDRPEFLALEEVARDEIAALAIRCRNREALGAHSGPGPGSVGVRALFSGPSGSGKTLAARRLAFDLARDIWRIDLAATVSKYIGETEKALDRAFAAAEELDCILLLDEGDALMARRTDVGNSNDRYANLETNFLLQRIECFSGILIVTTNAADRIDQAFQRRMDVIVPFRAPDELRRYEILEHHLGDHRASDELVQEIAVRCALSGGQLRNVALHARLLALDGGCAIDDEALRRAVFREYRKLDSHCPLKPLLSAVG